MKKSKKLKKNHRTYRKNQRIHSKKLKRNRRTYRTTNMVGGIRLSDLLYDDELLGEYKSKPGTHSWYSLHPDLSLPPLESSRPLTTIAQFQGDNTYIPSLESAKKKEINNSSCPDLLIKASFNPKIIAHDAYLSGEMTCENSLHPKYIDGAYCCSDTMPTDQEMFDHTTFLLLSALQNSSVEEFKRSKSSRIIQKIFDKRKELMAKLKIDTPDELVELLTSKIKEAKATSTMNTDSEGSWVPDSHTIRNTGANALAAFEARKQNAPSNPPYPDEKASKEDYKKYLELNGIYMKWNTEKRLRKEELSKQFPFLSF
jgi:hypothetical protein